MGTSVSPGEHDHNYSTFAFYEGDHPHYSCYSCSICGDIVRDETETNYYDQCFTCNTPSQPSLLNMAVAYPPNGTISFNWDATTYTTHYNLWIEKENDSGEYVKSEYISYATSGLSQTLTEGNYRVQVQSYNFNFWENDVCPSTFSDWYYFTVSSDYICLINGHDTTTVVESPTCTQDGATKEICKVCNQTVSETVIPAPGHTPVTDSGFAATCTETGLSDGSHCSVCQEIIVEQTVVPAAGHALLEFSGEAATCEKNGNLACWICRSCTKIFADEEATQEIKLPDITIAAIGHSYISVVTAPTCAEGGYTTYTCTACGDSYIADETAISEHTLTYVDNGDGTHTASCANCDYSAVEDHTFTDGSCVCGAVEVTGPTYVESLSFLTSSVSLGASLNRLYVVKKTTVSPYSSFYVEIEKDVWNGEPVTYRFDDLSAYTESSAAYTLKFENISAKEMGDEFRATIHAFDADGNEYYGPAMVSSMEGYLKNVLRNGTTAAQIKMKPLCVDMLNYGAAAQNYFEYNTANLVNADLTEEELALGTVSTPTYENIYAVTDTGNPITVQAKAASFGSKVNMNVIFNVTNYTGDYNELVYKVIDENGDVVATGGVTVNGTTRKTCTVKFDDVAAKKMRQTYRTGLYVGDTLVSAVQVWSIESYVATVMEGASYKQTMKDLAIATLIYGDADASYLAS